MTNDRSLTTWTQTLLIVFISLILIYVGRDFLIPLVLAIMTWGLLNAMANHLQRLPIGNGIPRWLAMTLSVLSLFGLFLMLYQVLVSQSDSLVAAAPVYEENFSRMAANILDRFGIEELPSSDTFLTGINVGSLLSWLGGSVGSLFSNLLLVFIYTGFLFAEQHVMGNKVDAIHNGSKNAAPTKAVFTEIANQVQHYIWMKSIISLATALLSYGVLKLVGVDFAAVWALLIFFLNFIPNIGSILGVALPAVLSLIQFDTLTPFLLITVGLGTVQFVIGNVIEPSMMGKSLNLSSFMIILSLTFWGMLWGIPGMFLSVPIMVMFTIVCSHIERLRPVAIILSADGNLSNTNEIP